MQAAALTAALAAMEPMKLQTPLRDTPLRDAARAILARRAELTSPIRMRA